MPLFSKPAPMPLFDFVMKATPQKAISYLETHDKNPEQLGTTMGLMILDGARHIVTPKKDVPKPLATFGIHPDVFAFEAILFSAFAFRHAYEPPVDEDDDDWDDDEEFDEEMDEAWKTSYALIITLTEQLCRWDTEAILQRRLMRYMSLSDLRKATEEFISTVQMVGDAKEPMLKYTGPPSLELGSISLSIGVMAFAASMPAGYAESLRRMVQLTGIGKPPRR